MNRRAFLGLLGAGAAGFALDPERLLWVPGQKTYFLPTPQPMLFGIGDWVMIEPDIAARYSDGGNEWVIPSKILRKMDGTARGRVGVLTAYMDGQPLVQVYGRADIRAIVHSSAHPGAPRMSDVSVGLNHPYVDGQPVVTGATLLMDPADWRTGDSATSPADRATSYTPRA